MIASLNATTKNKSLIADLSNIDESINVIDDNINIEDDDSIYYE